jgi:hypothetical protein
VRRFLTIVCASVTLATGASADEARYRLVLGSFSGAANAQHWAQTVSRELSVEVEVLPFSDGDRRGFRVATGPLETDRLLAVAERAQARGIASWRLPEPVEVVDAAPPPVDTAPPADGPRRDESAARTDVEAAVPSVAPVSERIAPTADDGHDVDLDLGVQTRAFAHAGAAGQDSLQPSLSARLQYYRGWDDDRTSFRAIPFVRVDAEDDERTRADLREFQVTHVGEDWEVHAGVRQVFWGVTEFVHLVDVVNQIDFAENIDGEDRLGQPMVDLSLVRPWGVLDFMVLPGFRERTFPGEDGRLRYAVPVDTDGARYESGDEQWHVDWAARMRGSAGPVEYGLYHFRGTSRDPDLLPTATGSDDLVLTPYYPQIDQTGLDAQAIVGDWLWKLEALRRSGQGGHYNAATGGFEWTWVGALSTRADVGFVLEYMYDGRGDRRASMWEHDVGFATRWRFNDVADSQTLLGVTWDHVTDEYVVKLEGSRRLGDSWSMSLEGRLFGGTESIPDGPPAAWLETLTDPDEKTASVQRDDYVQLELIRYF